MKIRKKGYWILFILTLIFALAAVLTILPSKRVDEACMLGYNALCTFVPISTIICIGLAGLTCFIRKRFFVSYK